MLEGHVRLAVPDDPEAVLRPGDVALIPDAQDFEASSVVPPARRLDPDPVVTGPGRVRLGEADVAPDTRLVVGYCRFGSPDAQVLVGLLPRLALARSEAEEGNGGGRLATLARLLDDEGRAARPGRDAVLRRLVEILLIEALRGAGASAAPGLLRGLADPRLVPALRRLHERPEQPWTIEALAHEAALSRSAFFERFRRAVGVAPMTYLAQWRMALAREMLRCGDAPLAAVAARAGYGSVSAFSAAFARQQGVAPATWARREAREE